MSKDTVQGGSDVTGSTLTGTGISSGLDAFTASNAYMTPASSTPQDNIDSDVDMMEFETP